MVLSAPLSQKSGAVASKSAHKNTVNHMKKDSVVNIKNPWSRLKSIKIYLLKRKTCLKQNLSLVTFCLSMFTVLYKYYNLEINKIYKFNERGIVRE